VIELKLGRTAPEVDLAQACLYYEMLFSSCETGPGNSEGALAILSFLPEPRERLFRTDELVHVRPRLVRLVGRLAGVLPGEEPARASKPIDAKRQASEHKKTRRQKASQEQIDHGKQLVATFREYNAPLELDGEPIVGPTFLRYPVVLGRGVKVASVKGRIEEVQMRLKLAEAPIINMSGGQVTIDVQRPDRQFVTFEEIEGLLPEPDPLTGCSQVPIGIDLDGELRLANLGEPEHCHLLIAGTTGSGKSETLRSMLAGLLITNTPQTLRLVLIDPKRNAFHELNDSPFLWQPIVYPDENPAVDVLESLVKEMNRRYAALNGADTMEQRVRRTGTPMPRIVCVCDEYFDLIQRGRTERQSMEQQLFRLGAKARAAGIHLIIATQQPSREVIKGALDANIPARVGLKTNNGIESSMLLGTTGAENLLGNGDLLFKAIGDPVRLQSPYLLEDQRRAIFSGQMPGESRHVSGRNTDRA
jgi:DNA segregation ATPase FtsK/SpoIIIE-like protein